MIALPDFGRIRFTRIARPSGDLQAPVGAQKKAAWRGLISREETQVSCSMPVSDPLWRRDAVDVCRACLQYLNSGRDRYAICFTVQES